LILSELGCHNITGNNKFITCGNPDGDNPKALQVYKNNLMIIPYTRNIESKTGAKYPDLIDYINYYNKDKYFTENLKWICEVCGYDFYKSISSQSKPAPLAWIESIIKMKENFEDEEMQDLIPIDESILDYYVKMSNNIFYNDGILCRTQNEFEIGYDLNHHVITIPIRDEIGTLVGVQARSVNDLSDKKYYYLEPFAKTQILYGLNLTMPYIKNKKQVIIVESAKSVMKLWQYGIRNTIAILGSKFSKTQAKKISMLEVNEVILCLDQDVGRLEGGKIDLGYWEKLKEIFINGLKVSLVFDDIGKLKENESPADKKKEVFDELYDRRFEI